ncbi:hypothetical protein ElyMa_003447100 [Elysia marginata]|uniref:Uncharacterized protein n=1 Tax=Elysia marginata TaxID=1093978 RepID=A0AAV4JWD2_9GAST|nr:hypothetical protein ElyMa_003447100 [Elysia marginata]
MRWTSLADDLPAQWESPEQETLIEPMRKGLVPTRGNLSVGPTVGEHLTDTARILIRASDSLLACDATRPMTRWRDC